MNADRLDGRHASAFSLSGHQHTGVYLPIGGTAANAALLDGLDSTAFAFAAHTHVAVEVTKDLTIPAAAFQPSQDGADFYNNGSDLWLHSGGGAYFVAPVFFESRNVTVNSITLYARDNSALMDEMCVSLHRDTPWNADEQMGQVCSDGAVAGDRSFTVTGLDPRTITGAHEPYLLLDLYASDMIFNAVRINYTYTP